MNDHAVIEQHLIETFEVPAAAKTVSVSLDRVSVRMEEPRRRTAGRPPKHAPKRLVQAVWRMAWCATVTLHDAEGGALHKIRCGRKPAAAVTVLVESLCDDVLALWVKRPDPHVALLCDEHADLWKLLRTQFTSATLEAVAHEFVKVWHTVEKLCAAARAHQDPAATERIVSRWTLKLLNQQGVAETIPKGFVDWDVKCACVGEEYSVHEAITYLRNHGVKMRHAQARARGLPTDGYIEATCKSLFEVRMKRLGARWHEATDERIVRVRALSTRWEFALSRLLRNDSVHAEELPRAE